MHEGEWLAKRFETHRTHLRAVAYRSHRLLVWFVRER